MNWRDRSGVYSCHNSSYKFLTAGHEIMNPIAIGTILLGLLLLAVGWILVTRGRKTAGRAVAVMGVCLLLIPFIVTYTLSR